MLQEACDKNELAKFYFQQKGSSQKAPKKHQMVQDHKLLGADRDEQMSISDGNFTGWGLSTCRSNAYGIFSLNLAKRPDPMINGNGMIWKECHDF